MDRRTKGTNGREKVRPEASAKAKHVCPKAEPGLQDGQGADLYFSIRS